MSLTQIQRGLIANGAVIVPDNLSATGTANASTFLRGDNTWAVLPSSNQTLNTNSNVTFASVTATSITAGGITTTNITATNKIYATTIQWADGSTQTSASSSLPSGPNAPNPIAIGIDAGKINQHIDNIAIGVNAGRLYQSSDPYYTPYQVEPAVAIGKEAGYQYQRDGSVAVGFQAGRDYLGFGSVAIGSRSGVQADTSIALGYFTGSTATAGGGSLIAIGPYIRADHGEIIIGGPSSSAGNLEAGISIGWGRDHYDFTYRGAPENSVYLGNKINYNTDLDGDRAVALGHLTAVTGRGGVAIGYRANAGLNSIAIGYQAGYDSGNPNGDNSIVLNATGYNVIAQNNRTYVAPIRSSTSSYLLCYNPSTYEVMQMPTSGITFNADQGIL